MHFPRKYEVCKSKTETMRDENVFLELKVKQTFFLLLIYIIFIVICQTCIVPTYSVFIIVSDCILFITLLDDLNLHFKLKRHNPSWGTSAYLPRGTSAHRLHHSKCCIMIIIMKQYANMCACVYICAYVYIYAYVCADVYACVCAGLTSVCACVRQCAPVRVRMCVYVCASACACACGRACMRLRARVRMRVCLCVHHRVHVHACVCACARAYVCDSASTHV